ASVEMMCYWAKQNLTLQQRLEQIYERWGYSTEAVFSKDYEGASGKEKMASIMANLRKLKIGELLAGKKITAFEDLLDGRQDKFPPSDVLIMHLEGGDKLVVRPSGTEPKIKYYLFFTAEASERAQLEKDLPSRIERYKAALS
ncbi:MAG: phospho-sugar mutase, partial [Spirochaetia bacterium]|nr:phospho-sugar mutase [Spirochaetia bacterium]